MEKDVIYRQTKNVGRLSVRRALKKDGTQVLSIDDDKEEQFIDLTLDKDVKSFEEPSSFKFKTKNGRITVEYDREQDFVLRVLVNDDIVIDSVEFTCEDFDKLMNSVVDAEDALNKLKLECEPEKSFNPRKNPFLPENRFSKERIIKLTDGHLDSFENDIMDSVERILDKANRYCWCGKITETELSDVVAYIVRDVIERRQKRRAIWLFFFSQLYITKLE